MAEYVEREAAVKAILDKENREIKNDYEFCLGLVVASNAVSDVPAADVQPVRHGRWIWDDEGYHCSECFYHAYGETGEVLSGNWHYCPNCGAKMDGGET